MRPLHGLAIACGLIGLVGCASKPRVRECPVEMNGKGGYEQTVETKYFDVEGNSEEAIAKSTEDRFPRRGDAAVKLYEPAAALEFNICPRWLLQPGANGCEVAGLQIVAHMMYLYPRWTPPAGAPPELVSWWNKEQLRTQEHEKGHWAIADEESRALYDALSKIKAAPTCEELNAKLGAEVEACKKRLMDREIAYDVAAYEARKKAESAP